MFATTVGIKPSAERMDNMQSFTCCICGKVFKGYGNNPWPANNDPEAQCCDKCNEEVVVPERILRIMEKCYGPEQSK